MSDQETVLTPDRAAKCLCLECAVQASSECVAEMKAKLGEGFKEANAPAPAVEDFPGVYCWVGFSPCADIAGENQCSCAECEVQSESGFAGWKYCYNGAVASRSPFSLPPSAQEPEEGAEDPSKYLLESPNHDSEADLDD